MAFSDYRTALVTGASGGIGAAIVERFCKEGLEVHAVARSEDKLKALAAWTGCIPHVADVADVRAMERILTPLSVDVLVNNAGVSATGSILSASEAVIDTMVDVNLRAILQVLRMVLPGMVERDRGHIVNISSIAAIYHFNGHAVYHATKAGLHALTNQIRIDVFGKHVRVTEVCPARVATDIFAKLLGDPAAAKKQFLDGYEVLQPEDVADVIAGAIAAPAHVNLGFIEIMPTLQVAGGLNFARHPVGEV